MQIRLENVRASFADVYEPGSFNGESTGYGAELLMHKDDPQIKKVLAVMERVANERWKDDAAEVFKELKEEKRVCLKNGNNRKNKERQPYEGYPDHFFVKASNPSRPLVLGSDGETEITKEKLEDGRDDVIYSGCYVHAIVDIWAQDNSYGRRINAKLTGVMFAEHGDPLGSGPSKAPKSAFDGLGKRGDALGDGDDVPDGEFDDDLANL